MIPRPAITLCGLFMAALFALGAPAWALDEDRAVDKAMRALKKSDRDTAAQTLEKALGERPDSAFLNYHAGLVRYDSGDYKKAKGHFVKALALPDKKEEARANYNAGNSLFRDAKELWETDPEGAVEQLKEALNYYGRAIELNNADKDASYNYELTDKVIEVVKKQIPPPLSMPQGGGSKEEEKESEQQKQKQQQKEQQQEEQRQEEQQREEQQRKQEEQEKVEQEGQRHEHRPHGAQGLEEPQQKEPSGGRSQPEETDEQPEKTGPQAPTQAPRKEDLSKEEALMLVETYGQEGPRKDINKDQNARAAKVLKNW